VFFYLGLFRLFGLFGLFRLFRHDYRRHEELQDSVFSTKSAHEPNRAHAVKMIAALAASFLGFGSVPSSSMDMDTDTDVAGSGSGSSPWWFLDDGSADRFPSPSLSLPHTPFLC